MSNQEGLGAEIGTRRIVTSAEIERLLVEADLEEARLRDVRAHERSLAASAPSMAPPKTPTETPAHERPAKSAEGAENDSRTGSRLKPNKWTMGTLAVAVTATGLAILQLGSESPDNCTSTTKIEVEGGKTWGDVSKQVTALTGLAVSDARLQQANPGEAPGNKACLNLPGPIVGGQFETPAQMTLKDVANASGEPLEDLLKLNKEVVASADDPLPEGTILWLKKELDKNLALQPYQGQNLKDLTDGTGRGLVKFVEDNAASLVMQGDLDLKEGQPYLLPVDKAPGPKLQEHKLTQKQVIEAQPATYDPTQRKKPEPKPSPSATPSAEAINPTTGLTPAQEKILSELTFSNEHNRQYLTSMAATIMELRDQLDGIDPAFMLAQSLLEAGENGKWGTSKLALEGHNYFGMKANNGWTGPVVYKDTFEYDADGNRIPVPGEAFRAFSDRKAGVKGYIDKTIGLRFYDDARKCSIVGKYGIGLLKRLDGNCNVVEVVPPDNEPAYATSLTYLESNEALITQYRLNELMAPALKPAAAPQTPEIGAQTRHIKLDPSKYSDKRDVNFWAPAGSVRVGNSWITIKDDSGNYIVSIEERLKLIEVTLNQVRVSAQGYEEFKTNILDLRPTIAADSFYANFNAKKHKDNNTPYGAPQNMGEVSCLINHYMAIGQSSVDKISPIDMARSMQNGGNGVAVQMGITRDGQLALYTNNYTQHAKNGGDGTVYNGKAYGVEVAAAAQESITAKQYEAIVYTNVRFLVEGGFVKKGEPVTPVVSQRILGHGEVNNMVSGGHTDFNTIIMDPAIRPYVIDVLVGMGYKA